MSAELAGQHNNRRNVRVIKLRHFVSRAVVECPDDGCDERGQPNQQRQHLERLLGRMVRFQGGEFPLFMLEDQPGAWPTPRNDREAAIRQMDSFDGRALKWMTARGMGWKMASPEWTAASEKANAADAAKADEIRARSAAERAAKGLDALAMMRDLAASTKATAARKPAPTGPAA
jgi:hypothetical protein